jgi:hypothetical protein
VWGRFAVRADKEGPPTWLCIARPSFVTRRSLYALSLRIGFRNVCCILEDVFARVGLNATWQASRGCTSMRVCYRLVCGSLQDAFWFRAQITGPQTSAAHRPQVSLEPLPRPTESTPYNSGLHNPLSKVIKNSVAWVRERTIPTKRPPPVGEVGVNFLRIEGATWSAWRIPMAVFQDF